MRTTSLQRSGENSSHDETPAAGRATGKKSLCTVNRVGESRRRRGAEFKNLVLQDTWWRDIALERTCTSGSDVPERLSRQRVSEKDLSYWNSSGTAEGSPPYKALKGRYPAISSTKKPEALKTFAVRNNRFNQ